MRIYLSIFFALVLILSFSVHSAFAVENDLGLWVPEWITLPVTDKWSATLETSPRFQFQNKNNKFDQFFIRPFISYKLKENLILSQGYSWNPKFDPKFNVENRIWEQVQHDKHFSRFFIRNRLRLEEVLTTGINGVGVRPRYLLGVWIPLDKEKKWTFVAWDEFWFWMNGRNHGPQGGFDRNWFFVGLNRKINKYISAEGGYNFQYINNVSPSQDKLNHVIQINFYVQLPELIKKKTSDVINTVQKKGY